MPSQDSPPAVGALGQPAIDDLRAVHADADIEVSILMPNFNCARYIRAAIASALEQDIPKLEVIVVDDCSTDDSVADIRALADLWPGVVRLLQQPVNQGSAAARNRALDAARGRWLAVLDSDDLMHPRRLSRLIARAEEVGADMIADDLLTFSDTGDVAPHGHLTEPYAREGSWVGLADFVEHNRFYSHTAALGYLKPVARAERWRAAQVRYDPNLRLAQDYDVVLRLLEAGLRYWVEPTPLYFYRKHAGSNSHRLKPGHLASLIAADYDFEKRAPMGDARLSRALGRRRRSLLDAEAFDDLVTALKAKRWGAALSKAAARPRMLRLLREPAKQRLAKMRLGAAGSLQANVAILGDPAGAATLSDHLASAGLKPVVVALPVHAAGWIEAARALHAASGAIITTQAEHVADLSFAMRPKAIRATTVPGDGAADIVIDLSGDGQALARLLGAEVDPIERAKRLRPSTAARAKGAVLPG